MLRDDKYLSVDLVEQLRVVAVEALRGCRMVFASEDATCVAATPTLTLWYHHVPVARVHITLVNWHADWRELLLLSVDWPIRLPHAIDSIVLHVHLGAATLTELQHHIRSCLCWHL